MSKRINAPPNVVQGFLFSSQRKPVGMKSFPSNLEGDYALLWWEQNGQDSYSFRVPIRQVASLTHEQVEAADLHEGYLVEVTFIPGKRIQEGFWQILRINGVLANEYSSNRIPWRDARAHIAEFLPHREPSSPEEALFWFLYPILVGTNVVIAGAPGGEKTALARWLIKSILGYKVLLQVGERPQEAEFYGVDEETEIWRLPSDMEPDDVADFLTFARLSIEARAPHMNGITVIVDSLGGATQANNQSDTMAASSRPAQAGGIDPLVQKGIREFMGMARRTKDGRNVTMINLWPLSEGFMASLANDLKAWANSFLYLDPHSRDAIQPFPWILNRRLPKGVSPTHRAMEFAQWVESNDVRYLWALFNTELPTGENSSQNGRYGSNPPVKPSSNRLGRKEWEKLAEHVFESWQRTRPQSCQSPRAIAGLLVRLWREWPLVVGYDGSLDVFPKEIREEVEGMLRRRRELEVEDEEVDGPSPFIVASQQSTAGRKGARDRRTAQQAAAGQPHNGAMPVVTQTSSRWVPDQPLKPGQFIAPKPVAVVDQPAASDEVELPQQTDPYELPVIDEEKVAALAAEWGADFQRTQEALDNATKRVLGGDIAYRSDVTEGKDE